MKYLLLMLLITLPICIAHGVLADYSFEQSPAGYTELVNPTLIHGTSVDDAISILLPIGFSFVYDDVAYTHFKACSNGFITLNPAATASTYNHLNTQILILAGLWDDLKTDTANSGVSYQLSGSEPNQLLTIQFKNLKWFYNASPVNLVSFQIRLYQGSNRIEYIYGTMGGTPGPSASASIGISGATAGNFLSVTPANPTATVSSTTEFDTINGSHVPYLIGYKYSFFPPLQWQNDLAAVQISGNVTPTVNVSTTHQLSIQNRGTSAQDSYTVKLFDSTNTELATAAGVAVNPGQTVLIPLTWAPSAPGPMTMYGKVFLAGDQYPGNDQTPDFNMMVQPDGYFWDGVVGDGIELARVPVDMYWKNSLFETLYYPLEMYNFSGLITGLRFFNNFTNPDLNNMPTRIWLGTTTLPNLNAGWIPSTELIQVFDGTVSYPQGENAITIDFSIDFMYNNGENLVLLVNRPMDVDYYASTNVFRAQTWGTDRARKAQSDTNVIDPAAPGNVGELSGQFPLTGFVYTPLGTLQGTVTGTGGLPLAGATIYAESTNYSTSTDVAGTYSLTLPAGTYSISAIADGYVEQLETGVIVNGDQTTTLDFSLAVVSGDDELVPTHPTALLGNFPNPFRPATTITYQVKEPLPVRIEVYNTKGQTVRVLVDELRWGGLYQTHWDGRNNKGEAVASGIYLLRMQAGNYSHTLKMMLIR